MTLCEASATELLGRLEAGELSSVAVTEAFLRRIEALDGQVGAFLHVDRQAALAQAEQIDARRRLGQPVGRLAGLPVAIKDVLCVQGEPTTCASRMLAEFRPPYDATVVARLRAADAVLVGKTNMDEFAMGGSTENSAFRVTRNPWDLGRVPGGSSGGAAACVAAGMASVRQPAALCGVTGLKPTYGRVSRYGLVAFASSLDQVGPLARTAQDTALLLEVLAGYDPADSTSVDRPVPQYTRELDRSVRGMRIGLVREHFDEGLDAQVESAVRQAVGVLEGLGATCTWVSLPHSKYAVATYYLIAPSEASSNLARYDGVHFGYRTDQQAMLEELEAQRRALQRAGDQAGLDALDTALVRLFRKTRSEGFGPEVKRRIMLGTYALSAGYYDAYYLKALKVRRLIRQDYDRALAQVDLVAGPVAPTAAFPIGAKVHDPLAMYLFDLYTVGANLAGIPAISVPCGFTAEGLPIGLQLQAPAFEESRLLAVAHQFQQATDWHTRRPPLAEMPAAGPGPSAREEG